MRGIPALGVRRKDALHPFLAPSVWSQVLFWAQRRRSPWDLHAAGETPVIDSSQRISKIISQSLSATKKVKQSLG